MRAIRVLVWVVLVMAVAGAAGAAPPLVDAPVAWFEDDRNDIEPPQERDPDRYPDVFQEGFRRPAGRLTNPVRITRWVGSLFGDGEVAHDAGNVNRLDEALDSTWFTNRIGLRPLSPGQAAQGPGTGTGPSGPWTVSAAKTEGVTPGFTITDGLGDRYLIKFDPPGNSGTTTAAGVIANRILFAAGYHVPDDAVITFRREDLVLGEGVELPLPDGSERPMTEADLDSILTGVARGEDGSWRALSSRFLSGKPMGPFEYNGRRKDDPNDRIYHQDRRELRGLRLLAAWINHFDMKQANSLDMYVSENGTRFIRHHLIDFASALGAGGLQPHPMPGREYSFDPLAIGGRWFSLGLYESPWRQLERPEGLEEVGYFEGKEEGFDPYKWKPYISNSAFAHMTRRDAYWAAKIISAFSDEHLAAIVGEGKYRNPAAAEYILDRLIERRDVIARRVFETMPPLDFFHYEAGRLRFSDLAVQRNVFSGTTPRYRYRLTGSTADHQRADWSDWRGTTDPHLELGAGAVGAAASTVAGISPAEYPFLVVEFQVDRGGGFGRTVRVFLARQSERVIGVER